MAKTFVLEGRAAVRPMIYAYTLKAEGYGDLLKVGYTERDVETRVREQVANIKLPINIHKIVLAESTMRKDGSTFDDYAVHRLLKRHGVKRPDGEWFRCGVDVVRAAIAAVRNRTDYAVARTRDFGMRPEQETAVRQTADYFRRKAKEEPGTKPRFLWNAKMRFGKTFAAYELAKEMGFKRILILTFKPAVVSAWEEDCLTHVDFAGWQFIRRQDDPSAPDLEEQYLHTDGRRPIVCFGSFQDFLGLNAQGGIKEQHKWVREEQWDLVIFDEYHYGAWREKAKDLFAKEDGPTHPGGTLSLSLRDTLPVTGKRGVHRRAGLWLDLRGRATGEGGLAGAGGEPLRGVAADGDADLPSTGGHPPSGGGRGVQ